MRKRGVIDLPNFGEPILFIQGRLKSAFERRKGEEKGRSLRLAQTGKGTAAPTFLKY